MDEHSCHRSCVTAQVGCKRMKLYKQIKCTCLLPGGTDNLRPCQPSQEIEVTGTLRHTDKMQYTTPLTCEKSHAIAVPIAPGPQCFHWLTLKQYSDRQHPRRKQLSCHSTAVCCRLVAAGQNGCPTLSVHRHCMKWPSECCLVGPLR